MTATPPQEEMERRPLSEVDRLPLGLLERVRRWALILLLPCVGALALLDRRAAAGVALGGAISLGSLALHEALLNLLMRPFRWRRVRNGFWLLWLIKWPLLGVALYLALSRGWVTPGWLCLGVGLVPLVATGLAAKAVLLDGWRSRTTAGGG